MTAAMRATTTSAEGRGYFDQRFNAHVVNVAPGAQEISASANEVLSTILGSCVAACIRDPITGLGGMNHFLLPGDEPGAEGGLSGADMRFGSAAMERLINALIRQGALRGRLEAKVFGGAQVMAGATGGIGARNIAFVERFLEREGIPVMRSDLGGFQARRVNYATVTGKAWVSLLDNPSQRGLIEAERAYRKTLSNRNPAASVEIF
jgi:chemotaxis protein CheD